MSVVYKAVVSAADKVVPRGLRPLWEHPAGPKTIFFWAPAFKWVIIMSRARIFDQNFIKGLVIAGIGDITRPAEKISISQCSALAATGIVWSRYSLVIIPKNWSLFSVNVFVGATNLYHLVRAFMYQQEQKKALENGSKSDN